MCVRNFWFSVMSRSLWNYMDFETWEVAKLYKSQDLSPGYNM